MKSLSLVAVLIAAGVLSSFAVNSKPSEPGGTDNDAEQALTNPDEYAWQLFLYLNQQAQSGVAGVPDAAKKFGQIDPDAPMVWETWALASGGPKSSEVYRSDGAPPLPWDKLDRTKHPLILDVNLEQKMVADQSRRAKIGPFFFPPAPDNQEVRMNRPAFEGIVQRTMYTRDGLEALLAEAVKQQDRSLIQLDRGAKEIKAQWLVIDDSQKARYLWHEIDAPNGTHKTYGLVSLHIITKDLPNWFWADFGHVDCENQKNACVQQSEPAFTCPVDRTTHSANGFLQHPPDCSSGVGPSGKDGVRNETVGTVWANYILRGTQTGFTTTTGTATILSNPVIEAGFQNSSCITCHARASVGPRGRDGNGNLSNSLNSLSPGDPELGVPNPAMYGDYAAFSQPSVMYLQTDFIWSPVFRSQRKKPQP